MLALRGGRRGEKELPKAIKRAMRSLVGQVHELELKRALEELYGDFLEWKSGRIDPFELSDRIHRFHDGPNRQIYLRYASRLDPRFLIRRALEESVIQKTDVPTELWPYVEGTFTSDRASTDR